MAKDKNSFIFYSNWKDTFDQLPNEKAGELIKFLLAYVNDENPETDDILINAVFANMRNTLKRDLNKWDETRGERSISGLKSAASKKFKKFKDKIESEIKSVDLKLELSYCEKKKRECKTDEYLFYYYLLCINYLNELITNSTSVESVEQNSTNPTVSVNVSGNGSVSAIVNENETKEDISFIFIWDLYEKKIGDKRDLKKKWNDLPLKTKKLIVDYVPNYKLSQPDKFFRKNFLTFLNNESWKDEIILNDEFENGLFKKYRYDEIATLNDTKHRGVAFTKFRPVDFDGEKKYVSLEDIKKHKLEIFKPD